MYVESKKYDTLVTIKKRSRLTDTENKLLVTVGRGNGERARWGRKIF